MASVFISEIKDWLNKAGIRTLITVTLFMSLSAILSMGRPESCFIILLLIFIIIGILNGREKWQSVKYKEWIVGVNLPSLSVIAGKVFSTITIGIIILFFLLPLWTYMMIIWGVGWITLIILFSVVLLGSAAAACLESIGCSVSRKKEPFWGFFFIGSWLVLTAAFPFTRLYNPFYQIVHFSTTENTVDILAGLSGSAGILAVFALILLLMINLNYKQKRV